jgi:CDGSH-type Zn-finger protein
VNAGTPRFCLPDTTQDLLCHGAALDYSKFMSEPKIAAKQPIGVELESGKDYWFCTCGHSANQPFCDGSHKGTDFAPRKFTAEKDGQAFLCQCKHTGNPPFCDGSHSKL